MKNERKSRVNFETVCRFVALGLIEHYRWSADVGMVVVPLAECVGRMLDNRLKLWLERWKSAKATRRDRQAQLAEASPSESDRPER